MRQLTFIVVSFLVVASQASGAELPWWVESVQVTQPSEAGVGSITLAGEWTDTCVPNAISHTVASTNIDVLVEHDGINVGCGDAITPWSLTEELGPLESGTYRILGTLYAVDPNDRRTRQLVSGPDVLIESIAVPEPSGLLMGLTSLLWLFAGFRVPRNAPRRQF